MDYRIKWFKNLTYKTQWNLSINFINHLDDLTNEDIIQIYNEQNPPMRKLIDIKEKDVEPLKIMAVKANKDLKNYIQDVLSEHVLLGGKKNNCI